MLDKKQSTFDFGKIKLPAPTSSRNSSPATTPGAWSLRVAIPKAIDDKRFSYETADITSKIAVSAVIDKVMLQVIISTVSPAPPSSAKDLNDTNIIGTSNLLEAAKACPEAKAFVYTSSDSACHPSPFKQITEDECILYNANNSKDVYGKTKALADRAVVHANSPQLRTAVIRVPLLYGEGDTNFIPQAVASMRKGEYKNQVGTNQKMCVASQAFFITDDTPMPFSDFMRKCYAMTGHPVVGEWVYWVFTLGMVAPAIRRADIDHLDDGSWWSIEKAKRVLGYEPVMAQDEAVNKSLEWRMKTY
ncbi:NAD(P)-binding protein [Lentithecium fluviatile CBS 122367]|uniref:NAD(P)-binding protein n=1 Tax=Lentithecium fluviatile CBS 122367 TaxID=1168545 RepID=A0A6G1IZD0_9PLEO|nr:NAD(P)-binding protein [Lentithecium fluviatile CBS 122367]